MGKKQRNAKKLRTYGMGIKYLTLYAFSTENWTRPDNEVNALMKLLESYLKNCIKTADKNNMRVRVIGDTTKLSEKFQNQIKELESASAHNDGLNLQIAINYGSRDEMLRGSLSGYERYSGSGSVDPHQWGTALIELSLMAAGLQ